MFTKFGSVWTSFTLFLDMVIGCDQLVTAGHTFILLLISQGIISESLVLICQAVSDLGGGSHVSPHPVGLDMRINQYFNCAGRVIVMEERRRIDSYRVGRNV